MKSFFCPCEKDDLLLSNGSKIERTEAIEGKRRRTLPPAPQRAICVLVVLSVCVSKEVHVLFMP